MEQIWSGLVIADLLGRVATLKDEEGWEPFRPGVHIRTLYPDNGDGTSVFLLRYQAGACIPYHEHLGYEHILVLDGAQSDERGRYLAGTLVINPAGSTHRVWSDIGCVVLIIRQREIRLLPSPEAIRPG